MDDQRIEPVFEKPTERVLLEMVVELLVEIRDLLQQLRDDSRSGT